MGGRGEGVKACSECLVSQGKGKKMLQIIEMTLVGQWPPIPRPLPHTLPDYIETVEYY